MITWLAMAMISMGAAAEGTPQLQFERTRIGEGIYEAASVFDVNNDGTDDIVSGEYWHEGPEFETSHKIADMKRVEDYYDDFSCYPLDVNGDGYLDIISGGWWNETMMWRENPQGGDGLWTTHEVAKVGNIERNCFYDIDGDGHVEVFSTTNPVHFFKLKRDDQGKGTGEFEQYTIEGSLGGHGFGAGDVNGDGRMDLLFDDGWMEAPENPFDTAAWVAHKDWQFGPASVPILVHNVNKDGTPDVIVGQGHNYGLDWYEQGVDAEGKRTWTKHEIEPKRSQFHEMQLADIDNDGSVELITGKRYRAHNGNDPGAADPLGLYYYNINGGDFERITLDYGPPETASGSGIYLWIADVDENGWQDVVAPGKEGLYLFKNMGKQAQASAN